MAGFYRSKYSFGGEDQYMLVTQFEATDARKALPCWDEPVFKATFAVTLTVPLSRTCHRAVSFVTLSPQQRQQEEQEERACHNIS
jgi:aminopeptidase N